MAKLQTITFSLVILLCTISLSISQEDSFQDLMYEYYSIQNADSYDELVPDARKETASEEPAKPAGEFGMTLSGMMNALADIQRRGDLMLEGVRIQAEKLEEINQKIAVRRKEYEDLTIEVNKMKEEKKSLGRNIVSLRREKDAVVIDVAGHKDKMTKMQAAAEPLLNEINTKKLDLQNIEEQLRVKKAALIAAATNSNEGKTALIAQLTASEKAAYCIDVPNVAPVPIIEGSLASTVYIALFASVLGNVVLGAPLIFSLIDQVSRSDMDLPAILNELEGVSPTVIKNLNKNLGPAVNQLTKNIEPHMNQLTKNLQPHVNQLNKNMQNLQPAVNKLNKNLSQNMKKVQSLKPSMEQLIKMNLRPNTDKAMQFSSLLKKSGQEMGHGQKQQQQQHVSKKMNKPQRKQNKKRNYGSKMNPSRKPTASKTPVKPSNELKFVTDKLDNFEQRFKNRFTQDVYYDLPRSL